MRACAMILAAVLAGPGQVLTALPQAGAADAGAAGAADYDSPRPQVAPTRAARLDQLFATLATASSADTALAAEKQIIELWMESGSDTIDLLMEWAVQAINAEDYPLALDFLDRITTLKPDYAEGWNKRATVYFLIEDYGKSLADLERVLALEPRHFAALVGLATIMHDIGHDKQAVAAYKRALALDPHLDDAKKALAEIRVEKGI